MELLKYILYSILLLTLGIVAISVIIVIATWLINIGLWYVAIGSLIILGGVGIGIAIYNS